MALELQVIDTIEAVAPEAWNACTGGHPFVQHAFLKALEDSGALGPGRGVLPRHVLLMDATRRLVACAPAMLKWGTLREHGPEIHWLRAGIEAGCFAWPKFQVGVPFFPVMGPKLLVRKGLPKAPLLAALIHGLRRLRPGENPKTVSNVLCIDEATARLLQAQGALVAGEWHSMWTNAGFVDWADYVARLHRRKRYQLLKERRQAESHGLNFKVLTGSELTDEVLADYYEGHRRVCHRYGVNAWLPGGMYQAIPRILPECATIMGYFDGSRFIAGNMQLHSAAERTLYMLQNSEMTKLDSIQLDLICYRPIEYALGHDIARLDSGLSAQHKQHRGWRNTPVYHAHWFHNEELQNIAHNYIKS
jgi:predicted N-acyltransferase